MKKRETLFSKLHQSVQELIMADSLGKHYAEKDLMGKVDFETHLEIGCVSSLYWAVFDGFPINVVMFYDLFRGLSVEEILKMRA